MIKRTFLYVAVALVLLVGGHALCQDEAIIAVNLDIPYRPMELIASVHDAEFLTLTSGQYAWVHEDGGEFSRTMVCDPGNVPGASAQLTFTWGPLEGPAERPEGDNFFLVWGAPGGFLEGYNGTVLPPGVPSAPVVFTDRLSTDWNIKFCHIFGFAAGIYTTTLTFNLTAI